MNKTRNRYRLLNNVLVITVLVLTIFVVFIINSDVSRKMGAFLVFFIVFIIIIIKNKGNQLNQIKDNLFYIGVLIF